MGRDKESVMGTRSLIMHPAENRPSKRNAIINKGKKKPAVESVLHIFK